jgi:hypothetical protein
MRSPLFAAAVLAVFAVTGCALDTVSPARTAERFHAAIAAHQDEDACAMLARKTADKLPDPGQTCADALEELRLGPGGKAGAVSVWGEDAQVRLAGDTVFLHRFSDGWRARATDG